MQSIPVKDAFSNPYLWQLDKVSPQPGHDNEQRLISIFFLHLGLRHMMKGEHACRGSGWLGFSLDASRLKERAACPNFSGGGVVSHDVSAHRLCSGPAGSSTLS